MQHCTSDVQYRSTLVLSTLRPNPDEASLWDRQDHVIATSSDGSGTYTSEGVPPVLDAQQVAGRLAIFRSKPNESIERGDLPRVKTRPLKHVPAPGVRAWISRMIKELDKLVLTSPSSPKATRKR